MKDGMEKVILRVFKGESIPYLARLLNLIDSYDVMSNGRPYKKKMSLAEIIEEIERCSGKQFDPDLAKEFMVGLKQGFL
jgi:response regulator RpfG family c-di-GMP phosphodiesterase